MLRVSWIFIFVFGTVGIVAPSPLAPLNSPCSPVQQCMGGAVCISNVCKCPPVAVPSGNACLHVGPPPVLPAPPNPIHIPATRIAQPAPVPVAPVTVVHQGPVGLPFTGQPVEASWTAPLPRPITAWAIPISSPGPVHYSGPVPGQHYSHIQYAAPSPVRAPFFASQLPIAGPAAAFSLYSLPGDSCMNGRICIGNSFCNQGSCSCTPNYALVGYSCIETHLVHRPLAAPAPTAVPVPIAEPAPMPFAGPTQIQIIVPGPGPSPVIPRPIPMSVSPHFQFLGYVAPFNGPIGAPSSPVAHPHASFFGFSRPSPAFPAAGPTVMSHLGKIPVVHPVQLPAQPAPITIPLQQPPRPLPTVLKPINVVHPAPVVECVGNGPCNIQLGYARHPEGPDALLTHLFSELPGPFPFPVAPLNSKSKSKKN